MRPGAARRSGAALTAALALVPGLASAHASERAVILTLPTGAFIWGAALAVAITAAVALVARRLPSFDAHPLFVRPRLSAGNWPSWLSFLFWLALVAVGFLGTHDPFENPLPLAVWTGLWIFLVWAVALTGDWWAALNPWTGPAAFLRRRLGLTGGVGLKTLGYLPAIAGFFGFAWLEIASLAPDDPQGLARIVLTYLVGILILTILEGEDWLRQGETFSAFFDLMGRIAPVWAEPRTDGRRQVMAGWPGTRILRMQPLPLSGIAFLMLVLSSVTFDGLHETFWWIAKIGLNPLEYEGRSAVTGVNTLGLLGAWAVIGGTIAAAVLLGLRAEGLTGDRLRAATATMMLAFLPIAAAYHLAHYLVVGLTQGQYVLAALNDPLHREWGLLGLPEHWVGFGFLMDRHAVWTIWIVQFVLILGAHLLAVILGLLAARRAGVEGRAAHLPVTLLMVGYTALGLWLLSTPTGA